MKLRKSRVQKGTVVHGNNYGSQPENVRSSNHDNVISKSNSQVQAKHNDFELVSTERAKPGQQTAREELQLRRDRQHSLYEKLMRQRNMSGFSESEQNLLDKYYRVHNVNYEIPLLQTAREGAKQVNISTNSSNSFPKRAANPRFEGTRYKHAALRQRQAVSWDAKQLQDQSVNVKSFAQFEQLSENLRRERMKGQYATTLKRESKTIAMLFQHPQQQPQPQQKIRNISFTKQQQRQRDLNDYLKISRNDIQLELNQSVQKLNPEKTTAAPSAVRRAIDLNYEDEMEEVLRLK